VPLTEDVLGAKLKDFEYLKVLMGDTPRSKALG
jgi:hypothetical protein